MKALSGKPSTILFSTLQGQASRLTKSRRDFSGPAVAAAGGLSKKDSLEGTEEPKKTKFFESGSSSQPVLVPPAAPCKAESKLRDPHENVSC